MISGSQNSVPGAGRSAALVILVGITANRLQRSHLASYFKSQGDYDVYLPFIPYVLGLRLCGLWLGHVLNFKVFSRNYQRIHFVNFIGGGYVFRSLSQALQGRPLGRIVYVRSPIQEEVPRVLARRFTKTGLLLFRGKMLADLSADWITKLPFPRTSEAQGLVIETGTSRAALSLGIGRDTLPCNAWAHDVLLPGADDVIEVSASHDEIYEFRDMLAHVLQFLASGRFSGPPGLMPEAQPSPPKSSDG